MSAVMMVRVEGMDTLPVGTKVVIAGTGLVGFIHGGAECPTHRGEGKYYIVLLEKGRYTEGRETFVNYLMVHPDNIFLAEEE